MTDHERPPGRRRWRRVAGHYVLVWALPVAVGVAWIASTTPGSATPVKAVASSGSSGQFPHELSKHGGEHNNTRPPNTGQSGDYLHVTGTATGVSGHFVVSGATGGARVSQDYGRTKGVSPVVSGVTGIYSIKSLDKQKTGATGLSHPYTIDSPGLPNPPGKIDAAQVYEEQCSSCHGLTARGTSRGPSLVGVGEAAVDFMLSTGRMPKELYGHKDMPYKPILTNLEIRALDRYVTALAAKGGPSIPQIDPALGTIAKGGEIFRTYCAACHEWGGTGGELINRFVPKITEATSLQIAEAIRVGPAQMPVFGTEAVSNKEINDVIAYVDYMKHPTHRGGDGEGFDGPVADGAITWIVGVAFILGAIRWIGKRT